MSNFSFKLKKDIMGIKSFQGARKGQEQKADSSPLKVSDYMSRDLITFNPNQSVEEVINMLIKHRISGGPVVNDKNELVGIISEGDCIKQISESRYYNMPMEQNTIEKHMVKDVETIDGNLDVFDAANKFLKSKRRRFPIVENGKLVGQISQKDILKAAMELKGQNWK
jgi:CBS domain-containing protein